MLPHPPLIVTIQDPPSRCSVLPTIPGFLSFAPPPPGQPCMAIYVFCLLDTHLSCTTVFHGTSEMLSVDVFCLEGLFKSSHHSLRLTSVNLLYINRPPYHSITPTCVFFPLPYPHLIVGDFNIHHPLADPVRSLSEKQYTLSALYLDAAFDARYHLLNTLGVYTHFPFDIISRPAALDLSFANTTPSLCVTS